MKLVLKNAKIVDRDWKARKKRYDIAIKNGKIESISSNLNLPDYKEIVASNLHVSIGFFDIGCQVGEPGLEHRENLSSIIEAGSAGGYTGIAPFPNTYPPIHSKSEVQFLINNTRNSILDVHPIGAISKNCDGGDITELIDMKTNGAVAFSDGSESIGNSGLMMRSLQYARACEGIIINHPDDKDLSKNGQIHEGKMSVMLGMEGNPEMAENLGLIRDIKLNQYAEGAYCAYNISAASSVKIIKKEKASTSNINCTVPYLNLLFTDADLEDFNSNLKVKPPLRSKKDKKALIKGLIENTIDAICSAHSPLEDEHKNLSFAFADFGAIGLETVFAALNTDLSESLGLENIIKKLTIGPRRILNLEIPKLK